MRWLHLSDFHFQAEERWDRRATLNALVRHLEKLRDADLRPDFVFVTGDIAFSGKKKEYEQAERFFVKLTETLELELRESFFFVPGNHDVDRDAIGPGDPFILKGLQDQDAVERVLKDSGTMALVGRRLENFYAFTERLLGPARGWRGGRPWRVDVRQVDGVNVGILQLNSAWASGPQDDKDLLVGEAQVREALEESADAFFRVVLVHHPLVELREFDREKLGPLYAASGVPFLLRGHLHSNRVEVIRSPDGFLVELAAGTIYTGGRWPRAYLLTEADLGDGQARVHFMGYADRGQGFWNKDGLVYQAAPDGIWTLRLPEHLKLGADEAPPAQRELTDARRLTLTTRYRTAAAAVHGTVRFVGFADHRPRPNVQVPELFVPLRLERQGSDNWTTSELIRHLLEVPEVDAPAPRAVVLGDPGSGKTTLCKYTAVVLAGEADCSGVEVPDEILPVFLPFREYVRACRDEDRSLLEFLGEQARTQLQLTLPDTFLEQVFEEGRAVLLLDGLDEVGAALDREATRERVQAFCRLYPKVAVLVTSRVAGYADAPLPNQGPDTFLHLTLATFYDEDLQRFVSSWYAVQEANDPVARDQGIADLMSALKADSRVRELARNPMLATLVALVHRYEAHLPGERAALYSICVKTLLETWPAARRRTFMDIDSGLQRAYLKTLAFRMQSSRPHGDREVVIERDALVAELVDIIRGRGKTSVAPEETRSLVEKWIRFLEEGAGILVEQRPGSFAFFHVSLMEYLAARGMEENEALEKAITRRFSMSAWREVCLLAVGRWATEKKFLDQLFKSLVEEPEGWSFLLHCLREEAAFDDNQKTLILRGAARGILSKWPTQWRDDQRALDGMIDFSIRHSGWIQQWLQNELSTANGAELRAVVALRFSKPKALQTSLAKRDDAEKASADLLVFWPKAQIGQWAARTVSVRAAFKWASDDVGDLLVVRSLASLLESDRLACSLVAAMARSTADLASFAKEITGTRIERDRFPDIVSVNPGALEISTTPCWPFERHQPCIREYSDSDLARYFVNDFVSKFAKQFSERFSAGFVRDFAYDFVQYFSVDFIRYFKGGKFVDGGLAIDFIRSFARDFALAFARDYSRDINIHSARSFALPFAERLTFSFGAQSPNEFRKSLPGKDTLPPPNADDRSSDVDGWMEFRRSRKESDFRVSIRPAFSRLTAEAWIALSAFVERPRAEQLSYLHRRVQNAWLLQVWSSVDDSLHTQHSPDQLALYLTLGFTQATTTWQWPATERWTALLGGEPPEHWLPRSQWHLCWLLYDSEDADHRRGVDEALDEGLGDKERPGVAEELKKLMA